MKPDRAKDMRTTQWDDLKVFLAIARAGSLVGAARAIGQTQPTMGRRLQTLEKAVGRKRVSSSEWFASHVLAPIFARLHLPHPKLGVELVTETRLLNLDRREADLVFRFQRFEEAHIVQKRLTHISYETYASRAYWPSIEMTSIIRRPT